jgi:hypothetical protein
VSGPCCLLSLCSAVFALLSSAAVQSCFQQAHQVASGWQFPLVLGQVAAKLQQQPGWQAYCLRQYAAACWQSRSAEDCGAAYLQPFVKLHGMRLKMLAAAVAGRAFAAAAAAAAGVQEGLFGSGDVLDELLGVLQLVGRWCFDPAVGEQLQPLLQQLKKQQVHPSAQQELLEHLQALLKEPLTKQQLSEQLQQQQQGVEQQGGVQLWRLAVELLVQDSSAALLECQACYMDPLAPARYSLAKGLYMLGRWVEIGSVCCQNCSSPVQSLACQLSACALQPGKGTVHAGKVGQGFDLHERLPDTALRQNEVLFLL